MLKNLIYILAIVSLVACGGGGGSSINDDPSQPSSTSLAGTSAKGIVQRGVVRAFEFIGRSKGDQLAETTTGEDGTYVLDVGTYVGLVLVEVTPNADGVTTTMKCDLSAGCDDGNGNVTDFGDPIVVGPNFKLTALLNVATGEVTVNLTPFTTASAELAQARIADPNNVDSDPASVVSSANSAIADLFGLGQDVTKAPVVDLTQDAAGLENADDQGLLGSALGSAAVQASIDGTNTTIESAIEAFVRKVVDASVSRGSAAALQNTEVDRIFENTRAVLARAQTEAGVQPGSAQANRFAAAENSASAREQRAEQAVQNNEEFEDGEASPGAGSEELDQVKLLVQDIRNLANGVTADALEDGSTAFTTQLEAAGDLISEGAEAVFSATADVLNAIGFAYDALEEDSTTTEITLDGITVEISVDGDRAVFEVDQDIDEVTSAEMTVVSDFVITESESEVENNQGGSTVSEDFSIVITEASVSGFVQSGDIQLTVTDVSVFGSASLDFDGNDTDQTSDGTRTGTREESTVIEADLSLSIGAELSNLVGDMEKFAGQIDLTFDGVDVEETEEGSAEGNSQTASTSLTTTVVTNFTTLGFEMSGEFSNANDERFGAFLIVSVDGSSFEDFTETETVDQTFDTSFGFPFQTSFESTETSSEESESEFFGFTFSLGLDASIENLTDDVAVTLSGNRQGLRTGNVELDIAYQGRRINFSSDIDGDADTQQLLIENQDGVSVDISIDETADPEVTGRLLNNGTQYGTISGSIIRYTDGTFQSL